MLDEKCTPTALRGVGVAYSRGPSRVRSQGPGRQQFREASAVPDTLLLAAAPPLMHSSGFLVPPQVCVAAVRQRENPRAFQACCLAVGGERLASRALVGCVLALAVHEPDPPACARAPPARLSLTTCKHHSTGQHNTAQHTAQHNTTQKGTGHFGSARGSEYVCRYSDVCLCEVFALMPDGSNAQHLLLLVQAEGPEV